MNPRAVILLFLGSLFTVWSISSLIGGLTYTGTSDLPRWFGFLVPGVLFAIGAGLLLAGRAAHRRRTPRS